MYIYDKLGQTSAAPESNTALIDIWSKQRTQHPHRKFLIKNYVEILFAPLYMLGSYILCVIDLVAGVVPSPALI